MIDRAGKPQAGRDSALVGERRRLEQKLPLCELAKDAYREVAVPGFRRLLDAGLVDDEEKDLTGVDA